MMSEAANPQSPRWYTIPVRVVLITFLLTLLSFAVCLFVAIVGTVIVGALRGASPDMRIAYRHIALPVAVGIACVVLVTSTIVEVRRYRQSKALAGIAQASR